MKSVENTMSINYDKLMQSPVLSKETLSPNLSGRASYYNKAKIYTLENGVKLLRSYDTIVAFYYQDPKTQEEYYAINGKYSATTTVHQRDFLYQLAGVDIPARNLTKYVQDFSESLQEKR